MTRLCLYVPLNKPYYKLRWARGNCIPLYCHHNESGIVSVRKCARWFVV